MSLLLNVGLKREPYELEQCLYWIKSGHKEGQIRGFHFLGFCIWVLYQILYGFASGFLKKIVIYRINLLIISFFAANKPVIMKYNRP